MKPFHLLAYTLSVITLYGCANSASHQVMLRERAGDPSLSCSQIKSEQRRAHVVIRGVEQDKEDMTGADVVDGLLWFPFNVLAKQANYSSALDAANDRIENLTILANEKGCGGTQFAKNANSDQAAVTQLKQLNALYRSGVLTEDEFKAKKLQILNNIGTPAPGLSAVAATTLPRSRNVGTHLFPAEQEASKLKCNNVALVASKYGKDVYSAQCPGGQRVISCEWQKCTVLE